jgi:membrane protein implicated in regulation of membrane protease activity
MLRIEPPRIVLVPFGRAGIVVTDFKWALGVISGSACWEVWAAVGLPLSEKTTAPSSAHAGIRFMVVHTLSQRKSDIHLDAATWQALGRLQRFAEGNEQHGSELGI